MFAKPSTIYYNAAAPLLLCNNANFLQDKRRQGKERVDKGQQGYGKNQS